MELNTGLGENKRQPCEASYPIDLIAQYETNTYILI